MSIPAATARRLMERAGLSPEEIDAQLPNMPQESKYHSKRAWSEAFQRTMHSVAEAKFGDWLYDKVYRGEITDLKPQARVLLLGCVVMVVDFFYREDGEPIWHEFKGFATAKWKLQKKLWEQVGPGEYRVTYPRRGGVEYYHTETIHPRPSDELIDFARPFVYAADAEAGDPR